MAGLGRRPLVLAWLFALAVVFCDTTTTVDETAARLSGLTPDPTPLTITNATHYFVSNERRLDLFADDVHDLGGVYVGVGSDQSYVFMGWARPRLAVLVDFDQGIVDLHAVYRVLFEHAHDPEAFAAAWAESGAPVAEAAIEAAVPDDIHRERLLALYREARPLVHARLAIMRVKMAEAERRWFLDDAGQYAHVRALHVQGRVVALRGDFTQPGVLNEVARTLVEAQLPVRVLYLSNIEQYFTYGKAYKANVLALPIDDRSVVLRTLPARPAGFEYIVQSATDFRAWLGARGVYSVYRVRGYRKGEPLVAGERHVLTGPPGA